jgi:hypothetical protein
LGAVIAGGFGMQTLMVSGSWVLLAGSTVVAIGSFALLGQAAAVSRARAELRRAALASPVAAPLHDHADYAAPRQRAWSPVPIPKPLYLSRSERGSLAEASRTVRGSLSVEGSRSDRLETAQPDHAELLRAASAEAESSLRAAQSSPEVTRIQRPSRFAKMGMIDAADAAPADLDEILRRRRAVG